MIKTFAQLVQYFGPYPYARHQLPSAGSQTLVFLQEALPKYNPIGAGWQVQGEPGWGPKGMPGWPDSDYTFPPQVQILTAPALNLPQLVGVVGPGGYAAGQVFNPPLIDTGNYS